MPTEPRRRPRSRCSPPTTPSRGSASWGLWRAGATWVPLNAKHPVDDNIVLLDRFDIEIVFYAPSLAEQVDRIRGRLTGVRTWIALGEGTGDHTLSDWTTDHLDTDPGLRYDPDDVVAISPTGGTTGLPKGVMNIHRTLATMVIHQMLAMSHPAQAPIVNLAAAPMTHTAGLFSLQATARGGSVVVIEDASADHVLDAIEQHRITEVFLPPTAIYRMLDRLEQREVDTSSLRYLMYGAAPMSVEQLRRGITRLGPVLIEGYGQMECVAAISFLRPDEHFVHGDIGRTIAPASRLASCGRPYPLITVKIIDPTTHAEVETGHVGEVCVRGDLVMKGYYKNPKQTAETIVDGWLHTGDLGSMDEQGYLRITDRSRDVIISGGVNIYPGDVEQVLWGHPAVLDCAVVGAPHQDWGEVVTAVVELKDGYQVETTDLIAVCRDRLGSVRAPKQLVIVDQLPRSANGKLLKQAVREQFWARNETRS